MNDAAAMINFVFIGIGMLLIVIGGFRIARYDGLAGVVPFFGAGIFFGGCGFLNAGGLVTRAMLGIVSDSPQPPKSDSPPKSDGIHLPSIDGSILALLGIGIGGLAALALVVWTTYHLTGKIRTSRAEHRATAEEARRATAAVRARWDRAEQSYRELQQTITDADHDLDVLLATPLLVDGTFQPTRDAWEALEAAQLRHQTGYSGIESAVSLEGAVSRLGVAWRVAKTSATSAGLNKMSPRERKSVKTARKLLASAEDPNTSPALRAQYYAKVQDTLAGLQSLAHISQKITEAIEPARRQAIEAA